MAIAEHRELAELHADMFARGMLKDKIALVTGASRGIGRATALMLAEAGANVAVNFRRSTTAAEEVCTLARVQGVQARPFRADVSHEEEVSPMLDAIAQEFGRVGILINNAGITRDKSFLKMTRAREVARKGVTVNAVAPGFIETDMVKDMPAAVIESVKAMAPVGRLGLPDEVAAAVVFLASPRAAYITGQVIAVNGGMYM